MDSRLPISFSKPCSHQVRKNAGSSCGICEKLDELNGRVVDFRGTFEQAWEERRAYLEKINDLYDPIQQLPAEIAGSIFFCCLPRLPSLHVFDAGEPPLSNVQFRLGSVCRYWRHNVWSIPEMWNILWLNISCHTTKLHSKILVDWLSRSGQLPLYISMSYLDYDPGNEETRAGPQPGTVAWSSMTRIMKTLVLNANRIQVLDLSLLGSQLSRFKVLGSPDSAVNAVTDTSCILKKLSIEALDYEEIGSYPSFGLDRWTLCPTHVSLIGIHPVRISIHWEHVTSVVATHIMINEALAILYIVPRLQHLRLASTGDDIFDHDDQGPQFTNSSLKSLDLTQFYFGELLNLIKCPALEELSCVLTCGNLLPLQNFIKHSKCPLKRLALVLSPVPTEDLVSILRLTPSLTHLSFWGCEVADEFLEVFAETAYFEQGRLARTSFLPLLRSLTWTAHLRNFRWSKIPSMIPRPSNDTNLICRPLSDIRILFSSKFTMESGNPDPESLKLAFDLTRDGRVSLKMMDASGVSLAALFREKYDK